MESTEDRPALRACDLIFLLGLLTVLLLAIRILRELSQLVGKFVPVELGRIQQDNRRFLDTLHHFGLTLIVLVDHLAESRDRLEASWRVPEQVKGSCAVEVLGLPPDGQSEVLSRHLLQVLQKLVEVIAAVRLILLDQDPLAEEGVLSLRCVGLEETLAPQPLNYIWLPVLVSIQVKSLGALQ